MSDINLPDEFACLADAVAFASSLPPTIDEMQSVIENLSTSEIIVLSNAYRHMSDETFSNRLYQWYSATWHHDSTTCWPLIKLLSAFGVLARNGVAPFNDKQLHFGSTGERPCAPVPNEVWYLDALCTMLGDVLRDDVSRWEFIRDVSATQYSHLSSIASYMAAHKHDAVADAWLDQYPITDYANTSRMYRLLLLFDEMGLVK